MLSTQLIVLNYSVIPTTADVLKLLKALVYIILPFKMADRASIVQLLLKRLNTLHNMLKCVVYEKHRAQSRIFQH